VHLFVSSLSFPVSVSSLSLHSLTSTTTSIVKLQGNQEYFANMGVKVEVIKPSNSTIFPKKGDRVAIHYTGHLNSIDGGM
jgi:FKBP-type peptidyl-prolyl cis-trans isomerase